MQIEIKNLMPEPLKELQKPETTLWNKIISLSPPLKYAVVAASGKGKSTFLNIIYGKRNDYTGQVLLDGKDIRKFKAMDWAKLRSNHLSSVFQDLRLFQNQTAYENIYLKNKLTDYFSSNEIKQKAEELGIDGLLNKKCGLLSFGERQRVAIIRSIAQPFNWMLLDEPFSHLDEQNSLIAAKMISESCQKNNAGLVIAALGQDSFFPYDEILNV
ncbi:MAG: ATP-binding cassette domain-containing protein [Chitinophagaceae bacterium]|nr:MAG: ATP-binding cassette domain-containing protein [Chitinophagaceae bacterium]